MPSGQGGGQYGGMMGGQQQQDATQAGQGWLNYPSTSFGQEGRSRLLDFARLSGFLNGGNQSFMPPPVEQQQAAPPPQQAAPQQAAIDPNQMVNTPWGPRRMYDSAGRPDMNTDIMRFGGR